MDGQRRYSTPAGFGVKITGIAIFVWLLVMGFDLGAREGNHVVQLAVEGKETLFVLEINEPEAGLVLLSEPYRSQWQSVSGFTLPEPPVTEEPEKPKPSKETGKPSTKETVSAGVASKQPAVRPIEKFNLPVSTPLDPVLRILSTPVGIRVYWTVEDPGATWELQYRDLDAEAAGKDVSWKKWVGYINNTGPIYYTTFPKSFPSATFRLVRTGVAN